MCVYVQFDILCINVVKMNVGQIRIRKLLSCIVFAHSSMNNMEYDDRASDLISIFDYKKHGLSLDILQGDL